MAFARSAGKVFLVGAGPGDPGLITWRGVQCLSQADLVLYDYLANPTLLQHAPAGIEQVCLGRHGQDRILSQAEINELMIRHARAGKRVVRLKGGDPSVFGHLAEEIEALAAAGIEYEVVPGITAALAAGSYAGIPITERGAASAVALVTGREQVENETPALDYEALAKFPGTLVFYMGVTTAPHWTRALIAAGKPAETPAALVRRCSWPDQRTILCTLGTVAERIAQEHLRPPVITIVGEVTAGAEIESWFTRRALFGQTILIARPFRQSEALWRPLSELGARCLLQPAIEIRPPRDWSPVDDAIARIRDFDWLVFSSANGVEFFLNRLFDSGRDARAIGNARLAAIGPGTADALRQYHLKPDLQPEEFRAEALAEELVRSARADGGEWHAGRSSMPRLLLLRASRGREVLADRLTAAGCHAEQAVVYESVDIDRPEPEIERLLSAGQVDWITVTSSAIARSLVRMFGQNLKRAKLASISPITSATLRELGYQPAAEARQYTMSGVVEAIRAS